MSNEWKPLNSQEEKTWATLLLYFMPFIGKTWVPASSWLVFICDLGPQLRGYSFLQFTLDRRIYLQGYNNNHSRMWTKPTRIFHETITSSSLSSLLITFPPAGRQKAPHNAKLAEVGTPFITGQLAKADIMYTDLIPDRDNPSWQRLTAVWFPRHPVL